MWSIIAASVVDLPEPVVPVSRMIPRGSSARLRITGGSAEVARSCAPGRGSREQTIETAPRWRKTLTRKRETPGELVGEVGLAVGVELLADSLELGQAPEGALGVVRGQRAVAGDRRKRAVDPRPSAASRP